MKELLKELEILTQSEIDESTRAKLLDQMTERAGGIIAGQFSVREHEVAIILLSSRQNLLKFEYPKALRKSGTIPMRGRVTMKDAIAVRTMTSRKGEVVNAAPTVKHLAIFEMVKVGSESPMPIQKMISVPLLTPGGTAFGVVQVSRKGENPAKAGADFSDADLKQLEKMANDLAPYLVKVIPDSY